MILNLFDLLFHQARAEVRREKKESSGTYGQRVREILTKYRKEMAAKKRTDFVRKQQAQRLYYERCMRTSNERR